jgi:hypothetical protein
VSFTRSCFTYPLDHVITRSLDHSIIVYAEVVHAALQRGQWTASIPQKDMNKMKDAFPIPNKTHTIIIQVSVV